MHDSLRDTWQGEHDSSSEELRSLNVLIEVLSAITNLLCTLQLTMASPLCTRLSQQHEEHNQAAVNKLCKSGRSPVEREAPGQIFQIDLLVIRVRCPPAG